MKPAQTLVIVRKLARAHNLAVRQLPGRGKGSHEIYVLVDSSGSEVERFGLTGHARELSWTVLARLEERLAPLFGEKWMER
jgi:hypothetical protein